MPIDALLMLPSKAPGGAGGKGRLLRQGRIGCRGARGTAKGLVGGLPLAPPLAADFTTATDTEFYGTTSTEPGMFATWVGRAMSELRTMAFFLK